MAYDLFHCTTGTKSSVLRFPSYEAAKVHAVGMFGEFLAEESDTEAMYHAVDIFTVRGEILAIEEVERSIYAAA
jgi:hypothetical protein